jgi:hypothetical protein
MSYFGFFAQNVLKTKIAVLFLVFNEAFLCDPLQKRPSNAAFAPSQDGRSCFGKAGWHLCETAFKTPAVMSFIDFLFHSRFFRH